MEESLSAENRRSDLRIRVQWQPGDATYTPPAEVTESATIHFDGGGRSPGPVVAACVVELATAPSTRTSGITTKELTTSLSTRR